MGTHTPSPVTAAKVITDKVLMRDGNVSLIVIDWKGEYVQYIPSATVIRKLSNIWDIPGDSPREKALTATEMIREMSRDVIDISPLRPFSSLEFWSRSTGRGFRRQKE
jgi:hypothetical protein